MPRSPRLAALLTLLCSLALVFATTTTVRADSVSADGDTISTGIGVSVTGTCTLPAENANGLLTFTRSNDESPPKRFERGQPVSIAWASNNPQVSVSGPSSTTPPSTYNSIGSTFTVPFTTTVGAGSLAGSATVTVTATQDDYSKSTTFGVTWDCPAPNAAPDVTVTGVADGADYEFGTVPVAGCAWTDDNDGSGTASPLVTDPSGPRAAAGLGAVDVACSHTDSGGLTGTATATYQVVDTTAPVMPTLADLMAEAAGPDGAEVSWTVGDAQDDVDGARPVACSPASGSLFPLGSSTVTCTSADVEGNEAEASFTVTVVDTTAPDVEVPEAMTVHATSPAGAVVEFAATVHDLVDGDLPPTCSPASGSTFDFGTTLVTCVATDGTGNTGEATFAVTVQDVTAPVVSVPSPGPFEATGPSGAAATWADPTAEDDIDGPLPVTCDHDSGDVFVLGETTVTCTAEDSRGNVGENAFVVTVEDTTGPTIEVPANITVEAESSLGAEVEFVVSATDLVDGPVAVSCSSDSGEVFALGTTTVTCTAEDSRGNAADPADFTVTVQDTTPPELPELSDITGVEATSADGAVVSYAVGVAVDLVDGEVAVTCTPASGATFPLGSTPVECVATDGTGNAAQGGFEVTVVDTTAPEFLPVSVATHEATGPDGAQVEFSAVATDAVDADPEVACTPGSGSWFPLGSTTVTCTATDDAGNEGTTQFSVNVADTTGPLVGSVPSLTLEATSPDGAVYDYDLPTATDLVDGEVDASCQPPPGSTFPLGTTNGSCSASDASGNEGTSGFVVTVVDTTAPVIAGTADISVPATSADGAVVNFPTPTAEDIVDGDVPVSCDHESGGTFPLGSTTVTCTATDEAGNTATRSFVVTVQVAWSGLLAPVRDGAAYKLGSTIPVKFTLEGASAGITDLVATIHLRKVGDETGGEIAGTSTSAATAGNLFRYTDGQYLFNLGTKGLSAGSWAVRVDLGDGVSRVTTIVLR